MKNSINGRVFTAVNMQEMTPEARAALSGVIVCTECGKPATYVRASHDGRGPHFRAAHDPRCPEKSPESEHREGHEQHAEPPKQSAPKTIRLVLNRPTSSEQHVAVDEDAPVSSDPRTPRKTMLSLPGGGRAVAQYTLKTVLKALVDDFAFRNSDNIVEWDEVGTMAARDLFLRLDTPGRLPLGEVRGYWGKAAEVVIWDDDVWLNSSETNYTAPSVHMVGMADDVRLQALKSISDRSPRDRWNIWFLALGPAALAQTGKIRVLPNASDRLVCIPKRVAGTTGKTR